MLFRRGDVGGKGPFQGVESWMDPLAPRMYPLEPLNTGTNRVLILWGGGSLCLDGVLIRVSFGWDEEGVVGCLEGVRVVGGFRVDLDGPFWGTKCTIWGY